jgi:hypothetical protein
VTDRQAAEPVLDDAQLSVASAVLRRQDRLDPQRFSKEQSMSNRSYQPGQSLFIATMMALGASGAAYADDSSMGRFGGESYAYFNNPPVAIDATASAATWRRAHPNGLSERELVALSSSGLSAAAGQLDPAAFSTVAADTTWHQTHPNGFTERELEALSSSSLAQWQAPTVSGAMARRSNVADDTAKSMLSARLKDFFGSTSGGRAAAQ